MKGFISIFGTGKKTVARCYTPDFVADVLEKKMSGGLEIFFPPLLGEQVNNLIAHQKLIFL